MLWAHATFLKNFIITMCGARGKESYKYSRGGVGHQEVSFYGNSFFLFFFFYSLHMRENYLRKDAVTFASTCRRPWPIIIIIIIIMKNYSLRGGLTRRCRHQDFYNFLEVFTSHTHTHTFASQHKRFISNGDERKKTFTISGA